MASKIQEPHRDSAFSEIEEQRLPQAPRVSRLAVLALVLGILSAAALASPLGAVFSLAAIALALAALRSLARADEPLVGRKAALAGLALAVFFAAWGIPRDSLHDRVVTGRARQAADLWLEMLREGRLYEAHQLMLYRDVRRPPETPFAEYYQENDEAAEDFDAFRRLPPLPRIIEAGDSARIEYRGVVSIRTYTLAGLREDIVTLRYELRTPEDSDPQDMLFDVTLIRSRYRGGKEASWRVDEVEAARHRSL